MANTKQAAKRAKKSIKQRTANQSMRTTLRSAIKKVQKAEAVFRAEQSTIDHIADKRIIHKNKASRHKSRLAQQIKALGNPRA
jgi:small subunit ribosomal protein S20